MMPITCAKPLLPRGRSPSSPTTRHVRSNIRSTSISMPSAISWNVASQNSSSSAASQPASKRPPEITGPSSLSLPSSYGCGKCPHHLGGVDSKDSLLGANQIQGFFWGGGLGCDGSFGFERRSLGADGAPDYRSS